MEKKLKNLIHVMKLLMILKRNMKIFMINMTKNNTMKLKLCEMGTIILVTLVYFYPLASLTQI